MLPQSLATWHSHTRLRWQDVVSVFEDEVFRAPAGLRQQFIDVGGGHHAKHGTCICGRVHQLSALSPPRLDNPEPGLTEALLNVMSAFSKHEKVLVFCNTVSSCRYVCTCPMDSGCVRAPLMAPSDCARADQQSISLPKTGLSRSACMVTCRPRYTGRGTRLCVAAEPYHGVWLCRFGQRRLLGSSPGNQLY